MQQVIMLLLSIYTTILVWYYYAIKSVLHIKIYTRITFIILQICMIKHKISIDTTLDRFLLSLVGTWFLSIKNVISGMQKSTIWNKNTIKTGMNSVRQNTNKF